MGEDREEDFSAVVTVLDPNSEEVISVFIHGFFGPGFREKLLENYKMNLSMKENYVFLPR